MWILKSFRSQTWRIHGTWNPQCPAYHILCLVFEKRETDIHSHKAEAKAQSIIFETLTEFSHVSSLKRRSQRRAGSSRDPAARRSSRGGIQLASFYSRNSDYFLLLSYIWPFSFSQNIAQLKYLCCHFWGRPAFWCCFEFLHIIFDTVGVHWWHIFCIAFDTLSNTAFTCKYFAILLFFTYWSSEHIRPHRCRRRCRRF